MERGIAAGSNEPTSSEPAVDHDARHHEHRAHACSAQPLQGWFLDSPDAGVRVYVEGVRALLAGHGD
jgi:hypothetical protein